MVSREVCRLSCSHPSIRCSRQARRALLVVVALWLPTGASASSAVVDSVLYEQISGAWNLVDDNGEYWEIAPNWIQIRFDSAVTSAQRDTFATNHDLTSLPVILLLDFYRFEYDAEADPIGVLQDVYSSPIVVEAALDTYIKPLGDPYSDEQWNLLLIDMERAWQVSRGDAPITIAFIDNGIDKDHPDLAATRWINPNDDYGDGVDDDNDFDWLNVALADDYWGWDFGNHDEEPTPQGGDLLAPHGTACAGLAIAVTDNSEGLAGIAGGRSGNRPIKWASVVVPRLFPAEEAIRYCFHKRFNVVSISTSLPKGTGDRGVALALKKLYQEGGPDSTGALIFASSGNGGLGSDQVTFPASNQYVIAVGATDDEDAMWEGTSHGGTGPTPSANGVELTAPSGSDSIATGMYPWTTDNEGTYKGYNDSPNCAAPYPTDCDYTLFDGTSAACPQAAGVAALLWSYNPELDNEAIRQILRQSAKKVGGAPNKEYGWGRIDAYRAMTQWGVVRSDTTWGVSGSPDTLYVSGDLTIDSDATLTINAGLVIRVAADNEHAGSDTTRVEINVQGGLVLDGTAADPIVFESFTDSTSGDSDWLGITFENGSSATITNAQIGNASTAIDVEEFDVSVTDWDTNKSLYLNSSLSVTSDYTIASGDSLLILDDTPVTVTGGQSISIEVNGTLISKGSAADQPEFLSSTAAARSWEWIAFNDSSASNVFHNTVVKHAKLVRSYVPLAVDSCTFSNGTTGVQSYDSLHITNSTISSMTSDGIHVVKGSADIANVEIHDSDFGLSLADSTTVVCEDAYIHDITYYGVSASGSEVDLTLKRSQVQDAAEGCRLTLHASAVVDSCQFFRNDIGVYAAVDSLVALSHCDIDSSSTNGVYLLGSANITMDADTVSGGPVGILCASASNPKIQGNGWITANNVGIKADASNPKVRDTRISANVDGVTAIYGGNPDLGSTPDTVCTDGGDEGVNSIHGNTGYHVVNLTPAVTILAECNWWGSAGPKASKFSGAVDHSPHRTSDPNPTSTAPPPVVGEGDEPPPRRQLPETFALSRNYPNPFNPTTVLGYDVPAPGERVTIGIYNVKGQLVTTLVSGDKAPGRYTATWHGRDHRGSAVASGVYFVRMKAGTFIQTRKIVLLK